jgi:hypothetical protein
MVPNIIINVYSFLYIYNTNKAGYIETKNLDLLDIVKNDLFFFSVLNTEKIVFSNSVLFEAFIKMLFYKKAFFLNRYKNHANLFQCKFTNISQFQEYLQLLFDLRTYSYFFIFPLLFKTYKISFLILYYFIKLHNKHLLCTIKSFFLHLINKISQYYLLFLSTILFFKKTVFYSFFSLLNTFKK